MASAHPCPPVTSPPGQVGLQLHPPPTEHPAEPCAPVRKPPTQAHFLMGTTKTNNEGVIYQQGLRSRLEVELHHVW